MRHSAKPAPSGGKLALAKLAGMAYDTELADRIRFLIGTGPSDTPGRFRPSASTARADHRSQRPAAHQRQRAADAHNGGSVRFGQAEYQ